MRIPRIYHPQLIGSETTQLILSEDAHRHLQVLRFKEGATITLFDGTDYLYCATLTQITKQRTLATIQQRDYCNRESPLSLHLGQVMSRGEKMEFTIQKSVELGVTSITPLLSERCGVKLDHSRFDKKIQQWQKIAIAACEQSGRNTVPEIRPILELNEWYRTESSPLKINLHPRAQNTLQSLTSESKQIALLIGPEGGLSEAEIALGEQHNFQGIKLGPRILRTETAALTTIALLQYQFGDLS